MGTIDHNAQSVQSDPIGNRRFTKLDVASCRILNTHGLAQPVRSHRRQRLVNHGFNALFQCIRKLGARCGEKLDAIIGKGVMRGRDDNTGFGTEGSRQISNARRGHRPQQRHINASGRQPRLQRRFEHVARDTRILADQYPRAARFTHQDPPYRPAQLEHKIRRDGVLSHCSPNTVCSEILSTHARRLPLARPRSCSPHP